ncbi:matrixin family metalloprotease [Salipaludibacillus sp. LMS25]|nr:matrixin family metalloprotease [Salipaludibacillus sp. LMS25]
MNTVNESSTTLYGRMTVSYNTSTKNVTKATAVINVNAKNVTKGNIAKSTGVHEWGHAFGIAHTTGNSIMNSSRDRATLHNPTTDDKNGMKAIYK